MNEYYIELANRMEGAKRDAHLELIAHTMVELDKAGGIPSRIMTNEVMEFLYICVSNHIEVKLRYDP